MWVRLLAGITDADQILELLKDAKVVVVPGQSRTRRAETPQSGIRSLRASQPRNVEVFVFRSLWTAQSPSLTIVGHTTRVCRRVAEGVSSTWCRAGFLTSLRDPSC